MARARTAYGWTFLIFGSLILSLLLSNILYILYKSDQGFFSPGSRNHSEWPPVRVTGKSFLSIQQYALCLRGLDCEFIRPPLHSGSHQCTMETCFDYSRCLREFKVYVYPFPTPNSSTFISPTYAKFLSALHRYPHITDDAAEACIFIPWLDTLDRDPLSPGFGMFMDHQFSLLPYWNSLPTRNVESELDAALQATGQPSFPGRNHLLFNLYAGTWPNYRDDQFFMSVGQAILAKASFSTSRIRPKFDVSLPLVDSHHPETTMLQHPSTSSSRNQTKIRRPVLLSFKGKRYVSGIGSASRNALFHLHNGDDIILVTTCRHGSDWTRYADKRCPIDMALYDKYDYHQLLHNSTFCLVPRGRRLGSYRFLEALQASCIPVVLSNDWELPFSEVIDWKRALVLADERLVLTLPLILRRLSDHQILRLRQQVTFLWTTYFRSIESIVFTTLEIIRDRISKRARSYSVWNSPPGGLMFSQRYSVDECKLPFRTLPKYCPSHVSAGFTVIVPINRDLCGDYQRRLSSFAGTTFRSRWIRKIILVWSCTRSPPSSADFTPYVPVEVEVVIEDEFRVQMRTSSQPSSSVAFQPFFEIPTLAVFAFKLELNISMKQLDFAYTIWQAFPNRLVGFRSAEHQWITSSGSWFWDDFGNSSHGYSIILLNAAFYHKHYHNLYWQVLSPMSHDVVNTFANCEDLLFNALVGHVSRAPPIKVLQSTDVQPLFRPSWPHPITADTRGRERRNVCLKAFSEHFSYQVFSTTWPSEEEIRTDPSSVQLSPSKTLYLPLYRSELVYVPRFG